MYRSRGACLDPIQPQRQGNLERAARIQYGEMRDLQRRFAEAEQVFREDLRKLPGNGWGLYGLQRALQMQRKTEESAEVERQFDAAWRGADLKIKSPCLCFPGV